jgi:AraC-like DNA-binding protein
MLLNLVSLLVGFLCLFVVVLMLFNPKSDRKTNVYLIIILFLAGVQRFVNGIEVLELSDVPLSPQKPTLSIFFLIIPVYYLFFLRLIRGTSNLKIELMHFILPVLLVVFDIFILRISLMYYFLVFSSFYFLAIVKLLISFVKFKKRSLLEKNAFRTIRTWTFLMSIIAFSLVLFSNYFLFNEGEIGINLNDFYRYSSLIWMVVLIYIFRNPVIIFGEQNLIKNIQLNEPQDFLIWSRKPLRMIEEKDSALGISISPKIERIILNIQKIQKSKQLLSNITLTPNNLSKELKIPRRHVDYIFKYHCHYSVNDFSNLVKVNYAVTLMNDGYLDKYTIASLGEKCLFNSRFTFSKNFKKFMGVSVSDYALAHTDSNNYTL